MIKVCHVCGREFNVKPSNSNRGWGKYCSLACRYIGQRVIPETRNCLRCGKEFLIGGATGKGRKKRTALYCSRACSNRGITKPRTMSEVERAWFAGLFDGEGCILQYKVRKGETIYWRITITNTFKGIISKVGEVTGISSAVPRPIPSNPKHSPCWTWQAHGENAKNILRQILPWLIVKRTKALLALEQS